MQPPETSTVVVSTPISAGSTENYSSDKHSEDEDFAFTCEEAQSILREWSADQLAEAIQAGMSRSRAAEVNIYVIFEILYGSN